MKSEAKQKLLDLESSGRYLFHGSSNGGMKTLEPRQSRHFPDGKNKPDEFVDDGEPSVSATPYSEVARPSFAKQVFQLISH